MKIISNERNNKLFREITLDFKNENVFIKEKEYSYLLIKNAYARSVSMVGFSYILETESQTKVYASGTPEFDTAMEYYKDTAHHTFRELDRILMYSIAVSEESKCKDCLLFSRCFAIYKAIDDRDCSEDPVNDCDFFIHNDLIKK